MLNRGSICTRTLGAAFSGTLVRTGLFPHDPKPAGLLSPPASLVLMAQDSVLQETSAGLDPLDSPGCL